MADRVSGSRWSRFWRLGWLSRHALPFSLHEETLARQAENVFATLGELKGLGLKLGQMLSYLDGVLPPSHRAAYQRALSRLQASAPALPFSAVEPILRDELGSVLSSIEETPFAAASIGQVHRARLSSGEAVAVKIQYPGIDAALRADLANVRVGPKLAALFLAAAGQRVAGDTMVGVMAEIEARLLEELDYLHEGRMQEIFRARFADDGDLRVPRVHHASPHVLVSELVEGRTLDDAAQQPQPLRDRWAAALTRAMLRSVYELRLFNGDPHPGNYLFHDDGRVTLLDFGCVKELPEWLVAASRRYFSAAVRATRTNLADDWAEFDRALIAAFQLDPGEPHSYAIYREYVLYCLRPYLKDKEFVFTHEYAVGTVENVLKRKKDLFFGNGRLPRIPKLPSVPPDFTFMSRLQWGFYSVMAALCARGNWHRMMPDGLRG